MILVTRIGTALEDQHMPIFNKKKGFRYTPGSAFWSVRDSSFDGVIHNFYGNEYAHEIKINTPVSSQGRIGSCVANALCDALEILLGLENPDNVVQLSRLFLYWIARDLVGMQNEDNGTYIRAAAQQLRKIGVVEEAYFPYDENKVFTPPPLSIYTMASNNRIQGFYRIESYGIVRVEHIIRAIENNHPVVLSMLVGDDFVSYMGEDDVSFSKPGINGGYHAMIVVGYRHTSDGTVEFKLRNSWGEHWGKGGYVWVKQDYISHSSTNDIWVPTRMNLV